MENLKTRLDRVENRQLDIFEKDSDDIQDQIEYWDLVKQEHLILHAARQAGIQRLGHKNVPALQVSEQKAKQAIEMTLVLRSLAQSEYGNEKWTSRDCSREVYETAPAFCMKKHGSHVHVMWDGQADDVTEYTAWERIYCQMEDGSWYLKRGQLDFDGLFYDEDQIRFYYADFKKDAAQQGYRSYEVYYKDLTITPNSTPIFTSTRPGQRHQAPQKRSAAPAQETTASSSKRSRGGRGRSPNVHSPGHTPPESPGRPSTRSTKSSSSSTAGVRERRGGGQSRRLRQPIGRREGESGGLEPGEVGAVHRTVGKRPHSRVGQLLLEARDPPVIVVAGQANSLKCLRYRIQKKYPGAYKDITTNFKWVGGVGKGQGSSRMLVAFESSQQRKAFEELARFPQSVQHFHGNLDQL